MKIRRLLISLALGCLGIFAQAQNGLENIIVEKYYVSNAADAAGSVGILPAGSVTYRIYVDMLPGYKFLNAYGNVPHPLSFTTTTSFFNNEDRGSVYPTFTSAQAKRNTVMLDSWLSVGAACPGYFGVMKSEDNGVGTFVNGDGILKNNTPAMGIPLTTQDGLLAGSPEALTPVGMPADQLAVLDATSQAGNSFTLTDGTWASLNGSVGPTATNRVLIAQITTDGVFHFNLNIQIGDPNGNAENYVYSSPTGNEIAFSALSQTLGGTTPPVVNLTSPLNNAHSLTGDVVALAATASDADGSVASVQFLVDGVSVGTDATSPYTANYTGVNGTHSITAVATDNDGLQTTSTAVTLVVGAHIAPNVSITSPAANSSSIAGDALAINATATGNDGSAITSVQFLVDGSVISTDNSAPYTASYVGVLGSHTLTARATDDRGLSSTSAAVPIQILNNVPPTVSIISPANNTSADSNSVVVIAANANDIDGTVVSVQFKADNINIGAPVTGPSFTTNWTPLTVGTSVLTAVATDNKGVSTTSAPVNVVVNNPNAQPYQITQVVQTCLPGSVCIPVVSTKASMKDVIGYDVVLNYDKNRVVPTGVITVSNDLINSNLTTYTTNIDTTNALMNISIFFNGSATDGTNFHGKGQLFCAEFNKTAKFKSVDTAVFSISSLDESYARSVVTKPVKSGKFITYKDSTFHGSLKFWYDNSPIKYNAANPNEYLVSNIFGCTKSANAVQPDTLGNFIYNIWNGTSIKIDRDILPTTNVHPVINAQDALLTSYIAVKNTKIFTPSVYQMIAMDVNADGMISAGDASQINQRAVLNISEFKQVWNASNGKPSKDWKFVNASTLAGNDYKISSTYPSNDGIGYSKYKVPVVDSCQSVPVADYLNCPLITSDSYQGILLGDVDASYAGIPKDGLLKHAEAKKGKLATAMSNEVSNDLIIVDLTKAELLNNGDINIPVSLSSTSEINSFDFDVVIDDQKLSIKSINNPNKLNLAWNYLPADKKLLVASYSLNSIPSKNTISMSIIISGAAKVTADDLNATLALVNGKPARLKVVSSTTGLDENSINNLVKVYPNPASEILNIDVPEDAMVQIFDLSGKQLVLETTATANQINSINVQDLTAGLYIVKVSNENFVKMEKVIISR
jgi:hypothetical protein